MENSEKSKKELLIPPNMIRLIRNIDESGNIYSLDSDERGDWIDLLDVEDLIDTPENPEVIFFVGCVYSYDPKLMAVTADIVKLLHQAEVKFIVLGEKEVCCGAPYFLNGADEEGKKYAEKNQALLNKINAKYIITGCPSCYRNLKFEYPKLGMHVNAKVLHTSEYLDQLLWKGRLKLTNPIEKTVAYHDPCELGRLSGIYRAPRRILEQIPGITIVEIPDYNKDRGRCCGGGGAVRAIYPQLADKMAEIRLWDISDPKLEIDILTSACPQCEANLGSAATRTSQGYEVMDIATLMVQALSTESKN